MSGVDNEGLHADGVSRAADPELSDIAVGAARGVHADVVPALAAVANREGSALASIGRHTFVEPEPGEEPTERNGVPVCPTCYQPYGAPVHSD